MSAYDRSLILSASSFLCSAIDIRKKRQKVLTTYNTVKKNGAHAQITVRYILVMVDQQFSKKNGISVISTPITHLRDPKWYISEADSIITESKKIVQLNNNMSILERLIVCLSEFGGTAVLVFLGCLGCTQKGAPLEQIAFTFGLAIMIGVQTFGHISGGHINPAVTVAAATLGHFPLINVPIYIIGQILGSITGFGLVQAITTTKSDIDSIGACSPSPAEGLYPFGVFLAEFILTFILIWICCAIWDSRNSKNTDGISIKLGLAVAGLAMAGGTYTGANMNPARSFGPALLNGDWKYHWAYWIGPLSAGFLGALSYRVIFAKEPKSNETVPEERPTRENT